MKRYKKELIIFFFQLLIFYVLPLFVKPEDMIGMVLFMLISTFLLSFIMGFLSKKQLKYWYPAAVSLVFIPSIFLYYNESAFVHALWYFLISFIGVIFGAVIYKLYI